MWTNALRFRCSSCFGPQNPRAKLATTRAQASVGMPHPRHAHTCAAHTQAPRHTRASEGHMALCSPWPRACACERRSATVVHSPPGPCTQRTPCQTGRRLWLWPPRAAQLPSRQSPAASPGVWQESPAMDGNWVRVHGVARGRTHSEREGMWRKGVRQRGGLEKGVDYRTNRRSTRHGDRTRERKGSWAPQG